MTQIASGEASLGPTGNSVTLRLEVGTMMALEEHMSMGIIELVSRAMTGHLKYLSVLFLAMTGRDFKNGEGHDFVTKQLAENGINVLISAVGVCAERTLGLGKTGPETRSEQQQLSDGKGAADHESPLKEERGHEPAGRF